jgi:hypothetical protein
VIHVKRLISLLALAFILVLVPAISVQSKKPLRYECAGSATGYGWIGEILTGDLEGATMIWVSLVLEFRGGEPFVDAKNVYFYEEWFIGYNIEYESLNGGWIITGEVLLAGWDDGVTRFKNGKFTGNGAVTAAAEGYTHLIGRKEHLSGSVYDWGPPPLFTGTVQIN